MTVRELRNKLANLKESVQDKEVNVIAPNGQLVRPSIKFNLKNNESPNPFDLSAENTESIVIHYDD